MGRSLFILDFDRTIFDTKRFYTDVATVMQTEHHLDVDLLKRTYDAFFDPEAGGYNIHAHHEHLLGLTADQFDETIRHHLGNHDYRFPDAAAWMDEHRETDDDLVIITMGLPRYQKLKFAHCSGLDGITKVIMPSNKGALLKRHIKGEDTTHDFSFLDQPYDHTYLIDDSAETFTALGVEPTITGIRLVREGQRYSTIPTPPGIREIKSFGDL
jgi:phosphoserine phosphatase